VSVRRVTTAGWVHPVPGSPSFIEQVRRVEPIVPIEDKNDELKEDELLTYEKEGKVKRVRQRPGTRLSIKA